MDGRVIHRNTALSQHLFELSEAEVIGQMPPEAEQDDRTIRELGL